MDSTRFPSHRKLIWLVRSAGHPETLFRSEDNSLKVAYQVASILRGWNFERIRIGMASLGIHVQ